MNKKGAAVFIYGLMLGITIIVLALALAGPTKEIIDLQLTELVCSTPSSDMVDGTCLILDLFKPLLIGGLLCIGIVIIWRMR